MRFGAIAFFSLAVFSTASYAHPLCDFFQRSSMIPIEKRHEYGERTFLPKPELKRMIAGFPGNTSHDKYRGARDYVAKLPLEGSVRLSVVLKSAFLYDLLAEISRQSDPNKPWEFEQYLLPDGSHVFEGGGLFRPVLIIRLSDGAMFSGTRPEGTPREGWKPDFEKELTPVGK